MSRPSRHILNFQNNFKPVAILIAILFLFAPLVYADVCVWRNPERTMTKVFPDASDYKTITKIIGDEERSIIEKELGESLVAGERNDWVYYEIKGKSAETLGYILSDAEKGEYGVIEIIAGISPNGKIKGLYIQRSQERDKQFKSKEFLDRFIGKNLPDIEKEKMIGQSLASNAVTFGVRKMLLFYDELGREK